jgi:hypothetical protein
MAPKAHGFTKGAYSKPTCRKDAVKSLFCSPIWAVLKSRARCTPAPGRSFSVSMETEERLVVAVCNVLVWYSIKESISTIISYEEMWLQVRKASLTAALAHVCLCAVHTAVYC